MTWADVAGKEFRDAIRSRRLWLLTGAFVIVFNLPFVLGFYLDIGAFKAAVLPRMSLTSAYLKLMMQVNFTFVPLIAILAGYQMIVGEHERGSLTLLLSLPHSRRDVFFGKIVGRTGVVGIAIATAYLVALPLLFGTGEEVGLVLFGLFGALTIFFGLAFFALSAGFSAAADTTLKAGAASFGVYVWFSVFWRPVTTLARLGLNFFNLKGKLFFDLWHFVKGASPIRAYRSLTFILRGESPQTTVESAYAANEWGNIPFYIRSEWEVFLLFLWAAVPALIGLYLFERRDL